MRLSLAFLLALAAGPALAQEPEAPDAAATDAASALEPELRVPALVAATSALYRERTGRYPATTLELLGSPEAERTGLRAVQFAAMDAAGDAAGGRVAFTLGGTREDATEREATVATSPDSTGADYEAALTLTRRRDPDFGGRGVPFVVEEPLYVERIGGRLCLDATRLRALPDAAAFAAAAPYFGDREAISVGFDTLPGRDRVAEATLAPRDAR